MMKRNLLLLALLSALAVVGSAQGRPPGGGKPSWEPRPGGPPPEPRDERRGPPWGRPGGGDYRGPSFEMFADNKVVKGAPYSATAVTETVQTLADGAKITHKKSDTVYRDSEGRVRREQTFDRVGPFSVGDQPQQVVFINDPVAGVSYFLDPQRKTARRMPSADRPAPRFQPSGPPPSTGERKTETLSKQLFDGVEAEGTRVTTAIPAGKIGNDRALEIVSERWEAPALQVVVLSKHKDPFAGETTYRLTDIKRAEPAHTFFEVPADYTLEEGKGGRPQGPPPGFAPHTDNRRKPPHEQ
ncbi:MAG: hypothetical protein HY011_01395 [Acidobacteria bacterium]|nr:hypothetical protein [Acidobacteriota bacterium]